MTDKQLKNRCRVVQSILDSPNFYPNLCAKANNDIDRVISLLAKIIDYVLNTNVNDVNLEQIQDNQESEYVIHPTNSFYQQKLNLFGLSFLALSRNVDRELNKVDKAVSHYPTTAGYSTIPIYEDTKAAIDMAHKTPSIVFSHILKQPKNNEKPMIVGASEVSYYLSVLQKRLDTKNSDVKLSVHKARKAVSTFTEKEALLVVIPKEYIDPEDIKSGSIVDRIPPSKIGFIKIPSRYSLIQICAKNRQMRQGTPLSMVDGEIPRRKPKMATEEDLPFTYSRYEKVYIDDTFDYEADDLTGDAEYDIDIIYGGKDYHKSREKISTNPDQNIKFIKTSSSMLLTKIGGHTKINNGRHRLVYMKKYFLDNADYYRRVDKLDSLREFCSIVLIVTRTFEDQRVLDTIYRIRKASPNVTILKNNPFNDEVDLLIINNNIMYNTKNKEELNEFYNNLVNRNNNNKFEIGIIKHNNTLDSRKVIYQLLNTFGKQIVELSFTDVVDYIKSKGIIIEGTKYSIESINLEELYREYNMVADITNYSILANKEPDFSSRYTK